MIDNNGYVSTTTAKAYLTAITALNIPSDECTGDWHFFENFIIQGEYIPSQQRAGIDLLSTREWLSNKGIYDCKQILLECGVITKEKKIYAANHYRAIADMVFDNIKRGLGINKSIILNDWLSGIHEKGKVYALVDLFKPALTAKEWDKIEIWKKIMIVSD